MISELFSISGNDIVLCECPCEDEGGSCYDSCSDDSPCACDDAPK